VLCLCSGRGWIRFRLSGFWLIGFTDHPVLIILLLLDLFRLLKYSLWSLFLYLRLLFDLSLRTYNLFARLLLDTWPLLDYQFRVLFLHALGLRPF